jgi:tetraacyldisaccharide 4'-kinase
MIAPMRQWLYEGGLLKTVRLPGCVVSVGNLSMGGTGKSPFALLLCEWAVAKGIPTALLSRGYKRKHKGLEIVLPGEKIPDVTRLGDEPWMIKNRLPEISLLVHADRARMAQRHWQELGAPRLVVLDDAFQHWRAIRDKDVLMLDATESLDQKTFPFGRLREKAHALARADLVVITRAGALSENALTGLEARVRDLAYAPDSVPWKKARQAPIKIAAADYEFQHFFRCETGQECRRPEEKNLILVAGVAKPDGVRAMARSLGLPVREEIYFPDHHRLSAGEIGQIRASLRAQGDSALLLTEKDWARWRDTLQGIPAYGIRVRLRFLRDTEAVARQFFSEVEACTTSPS